MFDHYSTIFDERGASYHQAMAEQPRARDDEFHNLVRRAKLFEGLKVLDIPSGGGYLHHYIQQPVQLTQVETSKAFYEYAAQYTKASSVHCEDIAAMPFESQSIDRILSMAGLHHIEERATTYKEAKRVLKPSGLLCIADVAKGSGPDGFLNSFVHNNSTDGHEGLFLTEQDIDLLQEQGFTINLSEHVHYAWTFDSIEKMIDYTKKMFGINQCSDQKVLEGISEHLRYRKANDQVHMNWSLQFIQAQA